MPVQVLSSQVAPCRTISCHFLWIDVQICSIFLWTLQALQAEYVQGTENAAVHWERRRTTRPRMEKQNLGAQTQNDSNECSQELTKHVEAGMFLAPPWSRNDFTWSKNEWMHTDADLHLRLVLPGVSCMCHHFNKVGDFFSSKSENHEHEAGIGRREGREVQWTDVSQNRKRTQSKALCATCMRTRSPVLCLMGLLVVSFPGIFWMWRGMSCARNTLWIVSAAKGRARPHTFHDISLGHFHRFQRFQRFHHFQCQETLSRFEEQARFAQQLLAQCARRKSQNVSKPRKHDISIKHAQSTTQRLTKHSIGQYQCTKGTGTCCYMLFHVVPPVEFEDRWLIKSAKLSCSKCSKVRAAEHKEKAISELKSSWGLDWLHWTQWILKWICPCQDMKL